MRLRYIMAVLVAAILPATQGHGQTPGTAPAPPLVRNGDFEAVTTAQNVWDGVDAAGNLRVFTHGSIITVEGGNATTVNFPCHPRYVDMDADGLKDLVVADPSGFIWIYRNSGEKGKPKFTTADFIRSYYGTSTKIWVGDSDGDGDNDIWAGTTYGHIIFVENIGGPRNWKFITEMSKPRYCWPGYVQKGFEMPYVQLDDGPMEIGTYMAPEIFDWDNDGKKDLLLGDGTYSANSIWLMRNIGSSKNPRFVSDERHYLAYGEGREQLVPTVCDINGDGLPDLIMSERRGLLHLYLNKKDLPKETPRLAFGQLRSAKPDNAPPILPYDSTLKLGGQEQFPGPLSVSAVDWNDDEIVDLLLGFPDGTMAVSINKGSKTEWKFDAPVFIKGTDTEKDFPSPSGWAYYYAGSVNSCFTVRTIEQDTLQGGIVVKPQSGKYMTKFMYEHDFPGYMHYGHSYYTPTLSKYGWMVGGRMIYGSTGPLTVGKRYEVSLYVRGANIQPIWGMYAHVAVRTGRKNRASHAWYEVDGQVSGMSQGQWQRFTKQFICPGPSKEQRIKPENDKINFTFYIAFRGTGYCYVDDVQLNEVKGFGGLPTPIAPTVPTPPAPTPAK